MFDKDYVKQILFGREYYYKKLLAIILAVVCIIPTMAVSFSVSAKATSNQVKTTNVSLYQYGESTYLAY